MLLLVGSSSSSMICRFATPCDIAREEPEVGVGERIVSVRKQQIGS